MASAQRQQKVRVLADGRGLANYQRYYLASTPFAQAHPEVMKLIFNEIRKAGEWVKTHPTESAKVLGPLWGNLDTATVELANSHRTYDVKAVVPESLTEQQKIADAFFREKLIPREINARDVTLWNPEAAITAVAR